MSQKIAIVIPVKLESSRVYQKNIRYLGNYPLVEHIIKTAKRVFNSKQIYLDSSNNIFQLIAKRNGIQFHKRTGKYADKGASNDEFLVEFMQKHKEIGLVIQLHSTSPFISPQSIQRALMHWNKCPGLDTLYSVSREQIEGIFKGEPINYDSKKEMQPSQELEPIYKFCNGLMMFKTESFLGRFKKYGFSMFNGNTGYIELPFPDTLDIDTEEDFKIAEAVYNSKNVTKRYFEPRERWDWDREGIMEKDGLMFNNLFCDGEVEQNVEFIINEKPSDSGWSHQVMKTKDYCLTLIANAKGQGNRRHYHPYKAEIWMILRGNPTVKINNKLIEANPGDIITIPEGAVHSIKNYHDKLAVRLALNYVEAPHVYLER